MNRFWSKVDQSGGPDACWPWTGGMSGKYGSFWFERRSRNAHVAALELHTGEPADGRFGLHSCDNPPCCNPAHLRWGTPADNVLDMHERGRVKVCLGEKVGCAKLTHEIVKVLRHRYVPRHPVNGARAMAREFGVCVSTVSAAVRGELWGHVG